MALRFSSRRRVSFRPTGVKGRAGRRGGAGAAAGTLKHHSGTVWDACFHGADTLMTCSSDGTIGALTLCPTNRVVSDAARSAAGGAGGAARAKAKQTPLPGFSWDQGMSGAKHRTARAGGQGD